MPGTQHNENATAYNSLTVLTEPRTLTTLTTLTEPKTLTTLTELQYRSV